ncbi:metal-sensing transcriptional repressor [Fusibacter ferrireducens]|uniref:Copper-sensing transcriptional repressor CsoR n=1 Tax=Fusibacter ferrireducens TaxID=2785058 RepID=A0ABR9ZV38_9FIRM|nr:metal-sensing transcriptional repressor [Fusibacter ferrireducens]MBF4694329.1 metal-sensing transcriptional repressor [Fusibacter ferrireducens]
MHKDRSEVLKLLKTSKGQIEGIIKMIDNDRYCIDISKQILAAQALLKKANQNILKTHMQTCVKEAFENDNGDEKIEEIISILDKYYK